jgi:hypothetical protein
MLKEVIIILCGRERTCHNRRVYVFSRFLLGIIPGSVEGIWRAALNGFILSAYNDRRQRNGSK